MARVRCALFDIRDATELRTALAALARRTGTGPPFGGPIEIGPLRLPDVAAAGAPGEAAPVWLWSTGVDELAACAGEVLRRVVFPLSHGTAPFCLAFPFSAAALAPRALSLAERALLDLEDIGRLLAEAKGMAPHGTPVLAGAVRASTSQAPTGVGRGRGNGPATAHVQADLDAAQRAAVEHAAGALRVLAPAGSGKTKTMINRVGALVAAGVPPGSILVLAFNTKAAEQLEERLAGLGVPTTRRIADAGGVHCATFNAFGHRYQRQVMGATPAVNGDAALQERLMRAAIWRSLAAVGAAPNDGREGAALDDLVWRALQLLAQARADCRPVEHLSLSVPPALAGHDAHDRACSLPFASACQGYASEQRRLGLQDFDDQVHAAVRDLLADPLRRRALQARYRHILVDEFQDLNEMQLSLVDVLSRPHRDLFVVGDDDQLIYGWRFARVENILGFEQRMPAAPHCSTVVLGANYRCSRAIVERSLRLISSNRRRVAKQIVCGPAAGDGSVTLCVSPHWPARAAALTGFLADHHLAGGCPWDDLAVLCRYRCQQPLVMGALCAAGVPHTAASSPRLFTLPAGRLLRGCLGLALAAAERRPLNPGDLHGAARRLQLPPRALAARLAALGRWLRDERPTAAAAFEAVSRELELEAALAASWRAGAQRLDAAEEGGPTQVLEAALLLSLDHAHLCGFVRAWDGWAAQEGSDSADAVLSAEPATRAADQPLIEPAPAGVVISTIHAAKGREYEHVVIADYAADLSLLDEAGIEEERRVLYVALTRARHSVLLIVNTRKHAPHPFVRELAAAPSQEEARRLRRELARLDADLAGRRGPAARRAGAAAVQSAQGDAAAAADPQDAEAAALRLRRLQIIGLLTERRLFAPPSRLAALTAALGVRRAAPA